MTAPADKPIECTCGKPLGTTTELGQPDRKHRTGNVNRFDVAWCSVCRVWLCLGCALEHHGKGSGCAQRYLLEHGFAYLEDRPDLQELED